MVADFLQVLINKAKDMGLLKLPIPMQSDSSFSTVQYVDDTLIIMEGDPRQLFFSQNRSTKLHYFNRPEG